MRVIFKRPKQKAFLHPESIQVGSSMDPKMAREASFTLGKFAMEAWLLFHSFIGSCVMVICIRIYE